MSNNRFRMQPKAAKALLAAIILGGTAFSGSSSTLPAAYAAEGTAAAAAALNSDMKLAFDKGIVEGYPGTSDLAGSRTVTRAELVTMIARAAKLVPSDSSQTPFSDLEAWQRPAVISAAAAGIVTGSGEFKPNSAVTREELAVMIGRAMTKGKAPEVHTEVLNYFKDGASISESARPFVAYGVLAGLFQPALDGNFEPQAAVTRDEAVKALKPLAFQLIDILTTNDIHGHIEVGFDTKRKQAQGGIETLGGIVNDFRSVNPEGTVVVDGGDAWQGTLISNTTNGQSVMDSMADVEYDAAAIGNHEFDFGRDVLIENIKKAEFPILGANIIDDKTGKRVEWAQPYAIVEKAGLKIGIIGLATPQTKTTTKSTNIEGLTFADPVPYAKELAAELRAQGADLVIVTSHLPGEQDAKSQEIMGELVDLANGTGATLLDAIVGGHSHRRVAGHVNGVPVVEAQSWLYAVGHIQLFVDRDTKKVVSSNVSMLETYTNLTTADEEVKKTVADYQAKIAEKTNEKIAVAAGKWSTQSFRYAVNGNQVRDGVTPIGNSVTDAMRWSEKSDIAFTNIGGLRAEIEAGDVTYGKLFEVLPFGNYNRTGTMTAKQIKALLEVTDKYSQLPAIQFSGLKVEWDNTKPAGEKYTKITLLDGTPVFVDGKYNEARTFSVTTNDFMATGQGDGFTAFGEVTDWKDGRIMLDAWVEYLKEQGASGKPISLPQDDREVRLDLK
ncbi:5'-nucleotidase C-terminal domain-containing protein [Paenibacillus mucilaginosus]|uniref:Multifunctional protein: 5-nucleotidase 2,3-cyclic-nucleotide 2-phosphodiesterase n=1 Tax=Paenibacillus mucilaginosus (strain KNP414) TaxID=1036673 RepID=F8F7N9_PAEMK|nr:5'-nucleotidase C-terminal domain-containing protein [Paenibacillus mucilaginosus]AEI39524.1 multifunctional protein: 5-nucleotidase 2,3-cyclic-nucleotide 2-phosphodiesterase [Paenibacillus mucilaginosus KNP414]MCG7214656.1 5'-nucleotidase C-terminal domain-containing protein [Paenibacillus mucilaginosus]WDM28483.1 5'-nucleotidase C-terminal domain-containing protein [Paenibacillus mucilaginosus]